MPAIIIPSRWTRQPTTPVEVDWSHPLARGLENCLLPVFALANFGKQGTVTGTKQSIAPWGNARGFYTTDGVGTGDRITFAGNNPVATGKRTVLAQYLYHTTGGGSVGRIYNRSAAGTNAASEVLRIRTANGLDYGRHVGGADVSASYWAAPSIDVAHTSVVTSDGVTRANSRHYMDGALQTRLGDGATISTAQAATNVLAIGNAANGNAGFDGKISLVVLWKTEFSAAEALELTINPWQIFKPLVRRIYFDAAAGTFQAAWARNRSQVIGAGVH